MEYSFHWVSLEPYWGDLAAGLLTSLKVVFWALLISTGAGLLLAVCRISPRRWLASISTGFIELCRIVPELVLIFWVYYCLPILLNIRLSSFESGVLALSLIGSAYSAEIFRAGMLAVPTAQVIAARGLGMSKAQTWRRIVIPQALRLMIPPFINYFADLLKTSSLLSSITVTELMYRAGIANSQSFRPFEIFTAVAGIYFICIFPVSSAARLLERRVAIRV
jgi:His/Glu/Gln/Arg/opine family amino acid ABC transporter permease subunit